MKKKLLIMRHAKAERDAGRWEDFDRPLSERGVGDATAMGRWLADQKFQLDQLIASPALRTRETARLVAEAMDFKGTIELPKSLYEGASGAYSAQVALCPVSVSTLLIVGHNPALEQFVEWLSGEWVALKTASVAHLQYSGLDLSEIHSKSLEFVDVWSPKSIGDK